MKKRAVKIIILAVIAFLILAAVYMIFFYSQKCSDAACFSSSMGKCSKTNYLNDAEDAAWQYKIIGKSGTDCKVDVTLLSLKKGTADLSSLQGESMTCLVPAGVTTNPQNNLDVCHGLLKENMQKVIINRLHAYITDNLGKISTELNKVI